jgi:MFS family permease
MPLATSVIGWSALRTVTGFASAVVFVIAVNSMLDRFADDAPHLPGWGLGGVGAGIALSGALMLTLPGAAGWHWAWWAAAGLAGLLSVYAWTMAPAGGRTAQLSGKTKRHIDRHFLILFASYTLEGIGYIVAGTFLVAAVKQTSPGWLANGAWLFVGVAAAPSAVLWARLGTRRSHPKLLVLALLIQAVGIAAPAVVPGIGSALVGALLFGATFVGVTTLALDAGRRLGFPGAVAMLTAGYSAGQIIGPVAVSPLLRHGFSSALIAAALTVLVAALAAALFRVRHRDEGHRQAATSPGPGRRGRLARA